MTEQTQDICVYNVSSKIYQSIHFDLVLGHQHKKLYLHVEIKLQVLTHFKCFTSQLLDIRFLSKITVLLLDKAIIILLNIKLFYCLIFTHKFCDDLNPN